MADQILYYNFSNADKTLRGSISFNQSAAADQQVTTVEGLNIFANYNGQIYTQSNDNSAVLYTDQSGGITDQGLGLQFVISNLFQISNENFIPTNPASSLQTVTYTSVPSANQAPTDLSLTTPIYYNLSSADKTVTGTISFNQAAADDQQVTIAEGLKISTTYNGQTYTQALDSQALLLTNASGDINDQGLGLEFVVPNVFTINADNFIPNDPASNLQNITYTRVPGLAVDENVAAGTSIGTFSSTDPDTGNTFTYSLVTGTGDNDNAAFTIDGNNLKIKNSPDFETKSSYNIRVKTTDNAGLSFDKSLTIKINDLNEAPTDLLLTTPIYYNLSSADKTVTGTISFNQDAADDQQVTIAEGLKISTTYNGQTYTQALDSQALLLTNASGDINDQGLGLEFVVPNVFTINADNFIPNDPASNLQNITYTRVPGLAVDENVAAGTSVGTFSSIDPDTGNTFTYSLVAGTGDTDNAAFTIDGNNLKIKNSPDFETKSSYNIRVKTTDQGGLSFDKSLTIKINDLNEAPTDLALSATSVNENVSANTIIGTISSTDQDANNTFTYSLVSGTGDTDNTAFTINGDKLQINSSPNFEAKSSYNIRVKTTDQGGLSFEKPWTINVNNIVIPPKLTKDSKNDVFNIQGDNGKGILKVTINSSTPNSNQLNELGVYIVDDANGKIGNLSPGDSGYAAAALAKGKVLFSTIANFPGGDDSFSNSSVNRLLQLDFNTNLRFYLIQGNTTQTLISKGSYSDVLFSSTQNIQDLGNNTFSVNFPTLSVKVQSTNDFLDSGLINKFGQQGSTKGELLYVTDKTTATFSVNREAAYNNFVGFYQVTDESGTININGTVYKPGDTGYTQAAINSRVVGLTGTNQVTIKSTGNFTSNAIFAPFIIANGDPSTYLNGGNPVYFSFLGANSNSDKQVDHIRLLGNNTFGFEDLPVGGDMDYNDMIVRINLT